MSKPDNPSHSHSMTAIPGGARVPYDSVSTPGAYVNWHGELLRVTDDSLQAGRSPRMSIKSNQQQNVTKISNDPFIMLTKAAQICADEDIQQNFV